MNTTEMSSVFDLLYDNASKGAPNIDEYEKSVYLTLAQEEKLKENYSGFNKSGVGFEGNEMHRRWISELVKNFKVFGKLPGINATSLNPQLSTDEKDVAVNLSSQSQIFALPHDLMWIVLERVKLSKPGDKCLHNKVIPVKPVTHDEFNNEERNSFRKPNSRKAWRMDLLREGGLQKAELFAVADISEYHVRYIKRPQPIILTNFEEDDDLAGLGLTVEGRNTRTECELNTQTHMDIVNRAVELATRDYLVGRSLRERIATNERTP